ncbi:hypothetical protein [Methanosphaerula subterraneus]|uniref:hypothetical protein n=1 Tax=Methanosphaerula subterraneus TaxID=3350244 RepID=UPI003F838906
MRDGVSEGIIWDIIPRGEKITRPRVLLTWIRPENKDFRIPRSEEINLWLIGVCDRTGMVQSIIASHNLNAQKING